MKDFKTSIKTVISHETGNTGVFLVSNNGEIKYRTAAELLSDIGGIGSSYIQSGTAAGQLMYWNGSAWVHSNRCKIEDYADGSNNQYSTYVLNGYATLSSLIPASGAYVSASFISSRPVSGYGEMMVGLSGAHIKFYDSNSIHTYQFTALATAGFVKTSADGTLSIDTNAYATQSWVGSQGFLTGGSLAAYATQVWVNSQGFITNNALSGYATQAWVNQQGFVIGTPWTSMGYATQSWVNAQGFASGSHNHGGVYKDYTNSISTKTTNYTLAASDANTIIEMNGSSSIRMYLPLNSTVAIPVGTQVDVIQTGAGQITFMPSSGVTMYSKNNLVYSNGLGSGQTLIKVATDTWRLVGDIA